MRLSKCGKPPVVFLQKGVELGGLQSRQLLILEVDVNKPLHSHTLVEAIATQLMEERCLACPSHTDHRSGLVR